MESPPADDKAALIGGDCPFVHGGGGSPTGPLVQGPRLCSIRYTRGACLTLSLRSKSDGTLIYEGHGRYYFGEDKDTKIILS